MVMFCLYLFVFASAYGSSSFWATIRQWNHNRDTYLFLYLSMSVVFMPVDASLKCRSLIQIKHRLTYYMYLYIALINFDDRVDFIRNVMMTSRRYAVKRFIRHFIKSTYTKRQQQI